MKQYDPPVEQLLNTSAVIIEEILLYGLYIIDIITTDNKEIKDVSTKILILMLRDMLENIDSIGILIKNGCTQGTMPLLRTVLESYLSILFMIKDDSENKAITYDVCHIYKKLEAGEVIKKNKGIIIDDTIKLLKAKLEEQGYSEASGKWDKYKGSRGYPPNWYNITEVSCRNIKALANKTGKLDLYNNLYGYFSMYAHGVLALINNNYKAEQLRITPLRNPHMVSLTCRYCLSLAADAYYHFSEKYLSTDDKDKLNEWYSEKRQQIDQIIKTEEAISTNASLSE